MRKIRIVSFVSLDGVMQAPGGPDEDTTGGFGFGGWVWPHFDEASGGLMGEAMGEDYDLLLGADRSAAADGFIRRDQAQRG